MKILFLHLSDMHLRDSEKYLDSRATSVIKAISANIKFDDAAILVTGDISQSGKTNEYKVAEKFFEALIRKFIEKYKVRPKVYVVPGNHDINFEEKSRTKEQVVTLLNNGITDSEINEEAKKIENFCKFANFNDCFVLNKEIDIKPLNFNGYLIQLNLINSSMFSTFKDKPGENDLGIHYLSEEAIMSLKRKENVVFSMTLMHHADEYFSSKTRMELSSAITDVSDVLLLGHDHFFDEYSVSRNKHGATEII